MTGRRVGRAYANIREFIRDLESEGELLRVHEHVSPVLEISEITDRVSKGPGGGKALLFERVEGSSMPVLTNAFGSTKRVCMALGVEELDALAARLRKILNVVPPEKWTDKVRLAGEAIGWSRFLPRVSRSASAPCREVVLKDRDVDLSRLPILKCWPDDGGRFVTLPVVITRSLRGQRNAGMYRVQLFDRTTMGMHWHVHKDGAHYFHEYARRGERMEVAVAIGTDPAVTYAATAPMPSGIDEMILAGFIRQKPVRMVKGITVDLEVPAEAEIVLEGYVEPAEVRLEGPFGDHTGFYSAADMYPVFHVTAVTHRKDPIYSATVVGRPPMEDCYLGKATERLFLPLLQTLLPEVIDYRMPCEGVFHNMVLVSIDNRYPGQANRVMHGLWGSGQMAFCKSIFVFDAGTDLSNDREVAATILDRVDLKKGLTTSRGILDVLDHASPEPLIGGKIGVDLTGPGVRKSLPPTRRFPGDADFRVIRQAEKAIEKCRLLFPETAHPLILLAVSPGADKAQMAGRLLHSNAIPDSCIVVLVDGWASIDDGSEVLWRVCANTDPARDFYQKDDRLVIDGTAKAQLAGGRSWPEEIKMSAEVRERVWARAKGLGISGPEHGEGT